jgi:predicted RNase H-like nuclease (RuvC/YqgF family)
MQCKYCGKEVEQITGKKTREYCSDSHRQLAYIQRHKQEKSKSSHEQPQVLLAQLEDLSTQNAQLRKYIRDKDIEIDDLSSQLARLRLQLDVEKRMLQDDQNKTKRSFKAFLKKQRVTPLISRILADPLFETRDTRKHYQNRLHYRLNATEEELQEFADMWKLMLLESTF